MNPSNSVYGFWDGYFYEAHYDYTYDTWIIYVSNQEETEKISTTSSLEDMNAAIQVCVDELNARKKGFGDYDEP